MVAKNILEAGDTDRLRCACPPCQTQEFGPTPVFAVIFDFYDLDGDGSLTESELLLICDTLHNLGYGDQQLDGQSVSRHFPSLQTISDFLYGSTSSMFCKTSTGMGIKS